MLNKINSFVAEDEMFIRTCKDLPKVKTDNFKKIKWMVKLANPESYVFRQRIKVSELKTLSHLLPM